jgi:V8-like Glu-specific endopeptidase
LHRDEAELWLEQLVAGGLVTAFVSALRARGVAIDEDALDDPDGAIPFEELEAFLPRAKAFRCRVLKNGEVAGSGVLVGPSLVLTSWHVIAVKAPGQPQEPAPNLAVVLSDNSKQRAKVPAEYQSECGDAEYERVAPKQDADVVDRNDVALLAMERPAAAHLAYAPLGTQAPVIRSRSRVVLIHFPEGQDRGIDFGFTRKIRNVKARWRHDVPTQSGSSGGACFDKELKLLGIHQGQFDTTARSWSGGSCSSKQSPAQERQAVVSAACGSSAGGSKPDRWVSRSPMTCWSSSYRVGVRVTGSCASPRMRSFRISWPRSAVAAVSTVWR